MKVIKTFKYNNIPLKIVKFNDRATRTNKPYFYYKIQAPNGGLFSYFSKPATIPHIIEATINLLDEYKKKIDVELQLTKTLPPQFL